MHSFGGRGAAKHPSAPSTTSLSNSRSDDVTVALYRCSRKFITGSSRTEATWEWKLNCATAKPLHISLHVEKSMMASPLVRVSCNGYTVFPKGWTGDNSIRKPGKLSKDFEESWPMRGTVKGMRVERAVEMYFVSNGMEYWLPGTLVGQCPRGEFDVMIEAHDIDGILCKKLHSSVRQMQLRYTDTQEPLQVVEHKVSLFVPHNNAVEGACLLIDGNKQFMHRLAMQSPAKNAEAPPHIIIQVPKHGTVVTANVSRTTLLNHSSRQVRAVSIKCATVCFGSNSWVIQIGHAQHKINVSRKSKVSKDITLEVDGEVLVEACPHELGCVGDTWECSFRLFGERSMYFHLLETTATGKVVAEPRIVPQKQSFGHTCKVSIQDLSDLASSVLYADGLTFRSLPVLEQATSEQKVHSSLAGLRSQYNIMVPDEVSQFCSTVDSCIMAPESVTIAGAPSFAEQLLMQMCSCCEHNHDAYDDPDADARPGFVGSLLTAFNWEGSKVVAPVSGRHLPPACIPHSRQNNSPTALEDQFGQREGIGFTPRNESFRRDASPRLSDWSHQDLPPGTSITLGTPIRPLSPAAQHKQAAYEHNFADYGGYHDEPARPFVSQW